MVWERPVLGRWFEDLEVGLVVPHALTRTITEADNINFSLSTLNPAPLHLDSHYAAETEFGRPLVNSMFTLALLVGISVHETTHGTTVANLGFESVAFPAPLAPQSQPDKRDRLNRPDKHSSVRSTRPTR